MNVGDRIVVLATSVWPKRVGCIGTVVAPPADGTYPQPAKWEVLLLLDDDPLGTRGDWSCVMSRKDVRAASQHGEER